MPEYYVTHPQINKTAVVSAPSTEKARTTFLDWLERNGLVQRRYRQVSRKDMVAKRLEDPNVPSDVVLSYGYQDVTTPSQGWDEAQITPMSPESVVEEPLPEIPVRKRMPIQEVMLGRF